MNDVDNPRAWDFEFQEDVVTPVTGNMTDYLADIGSRGGLQMGKEKRAEEVQEINELAEVPNPNPNPKRAPA